MREHVDDRTSLERRKLLKAAASLSLAGACIAGSGWLAVKRRRNLFEVRREHTLMQTSVAISCLADDIEAADAAIDIAYKRMAAAAAVLTRFDARSPVSQLNREGHLPQVPPHLRQVLQHALDISRNTDGAFDITVMPLLAYVESLPRPVSLTADERQRMAQRDALVDYRQIALSESELTLMRPGMAITLDGIAKGYVVDQGIAALKANGIEYGLIDAGGDVQAFSGADPNRHWNVGIVDPHHVDRLAAVVQLRNAALSTSGNYRVFFSADRRLFHIFNPYTGDSPQDYSSVTVMAERSVLADGMSTASFSMAMERLKSVMEVGRHPWLACARSGGRRWRSRDLPLLAGSAEFA